MNRLRSLLAALLLLGPALALATWTPANPGTSDPSVVETQGTTSPVTRTAPTVAGDGIVAGMSIAFPAQSAQATQHGLNVTVCSAAGTTLSGAGTVKFFAYDPVTPEWAEVVDLVQNVTSTTRCQTFLGLAIPAARGRLMAVATGVTFSGGGSAGVTVYMLGR